MAGMGRLPKEPRGMAEWAARALRPWKHHRRRPRCQNGGKVRQNRRYRGMRLNEVVAGRADLSRRISSPAS